MGTIFGTILAFAIVFGVLVFIHEFGHFFMAKLVGIRVEVFSFGYGRRIIGIKRGGTDYRLSLIPLGGYVKFLGEGIFEPGRKLGSDEFMAKRRWQRFLVILMGSVMNIFLAIFLVAAINMVGVTIPEYQEQKPVIGWIEKGSPAEKAGLRIDDEILSIDNKKMKTWSDVEIAVGSKPDRVIVLEIRRNGEKLAVPLKTEKRTSYALGYAGFSAKILTEVRMVLPDSPAERGRLKPGDVILSVGNQPAYFYDFVKIIEANPERELEFVVRREGEIKKLLITPRREGNIGKIGISQIPVSIVKKYGFFNAFGQSLHENMRNVFLVIRFLRDLFTGEASTRQLGGPLEIANFSYAAMRMGFISLLGFIAIISLQLGVLNLFPIPVLDGGQLFVLIIEGVVKRDLSPKLRQIWMQIGFVLFILLIAFVILNDIVKRFPEGWHSLIFW